MKRATQCILLAVLTCCLGGCAYMKPPGESKREAGSIIVRAQWTGDVPANVVAIRITVTSADMETISQEFSFSGEMGEIYGIHGVVAGDNRTLVVEGLDMEHGKVYQGSATNKTVVSGQIADWGSIMMNPIRDMALSAPSADVEPGNGKATIRWRNIPGAESYNIYLSKSHGASKKNFDGRKNTTSNAYEWTGLNNGTTYYFVVTAENRDGESDDSIEINATPQKVVRVSKAPGSPKNVRVKAENKKVTIRWDSVKGADSYSIYMNRSAGASKKNFDARKNTTSNAYEWAGLSNGTTYYFVVTTENRSGESGESMAVEATPRAPMAKKKKAVEAPKPKAIPVVPKVAKETPKVAKKETPKVVKEAPKVAVAVPEAAVKAPSDLTKLSAQKTLEKVDEVRAPNQNFVVDMTITSKKGDKETVNKVSVRVRDFRKSLVLYKYPLSQKGRVLLMVESNMWIYFPGTKRSIRISPQQQLLGQVSNADVARVVYNLDYSAETVEEEIVDNEKYLKMFLKAKTTGAAYGSIKLWIRERGFRLEKAEFFTLTGRILKTIYYKGYKNILGKERPMIHEIHDAIKKSEISIMEYTDWRIEDTPDRYFQKTFMQRVAGLVLK